MIAMLLIVMWTPVSASKITNTFYGVPQIHEASKRDDGTDVLPLSSKLLEIRSNGRTSRTVRIRNRTKVAFILTATCQPISLAEGAEADGQYLSLSILINNVPLKQTKDLQAFCSYRLNGYNGILSHAISGMRILNPGNHRISVRATPVGDDIRKFGIDALNLMMIAERP